MTFKTIKELDEIEKKFELGVGILAYREALKDMLELIDGYICTDWGADKIIEELKARITGEKLK